MESSLTKNVWICALLVLISGGTWKAEDQASTPPWTAEKIWQDDSTDASGDVSKDGRFLTFVSLATFELSVRDLNNRTNRVTRRHGWPSRDVHKEISASARSLGIPTASLDAHS